jgi:hypothetical protein
MKFKTIFSTLLVGASLLIWTGCGKDGAQGPAGLDGNANVIASQWYTPSAWLGTTGDWYFDISNTAITGDIVESGVILAYASIPGDVYNTYTVRPLPAFVNGANWDFLLPNDGKTNYGKIEFTSTMVAMPGTTGYSFRFVLVPAGIFLKSASLNITTASDLKKMSYQEVCKFLGIKE